MGLGRLSFNRDSLARPINSIRMALSFTRNAQLSAVLSCFTILLGAEQIECMNNDFGEESILTNSKFRATNYFAVTGTKVCAVK